MRVGEGSVHALFVNIPPNQNNPTNTVYYNLAEGERDGLLELLQINVNEESATVVHAGNRVILALKDNKPAGGGGAGGPGGGAPGGRGAGAARPGLPATSGSSGPSAPSSIQAKVVGGQPYSSGSGSGISVSGGGATAVASDVAHQVSQDNATAYAASTAAMINAHSDTTRAMPPMPPILDTSSTESGTTKGPVIIHQTRLPPSVK